MLWEDRDCQSLTICLKVKRYLQDSKMFQVIFVVLLSVRQCEKFVLNCEEKIFRDILELFLSN